MYSISTIERVKLNYSMCSVAAIIIYTFVIQFAPHRLWLTVLFFILAECMKLGVIQKVYTLDTTNNMEGIIRKRRNRVTESIKFSLLMIFTVFFFAFICILLGGELFNYLTSLSPNHTLNFSSST